MLSDVGDPEELPVPNAPPEVDRFLAALDRGARVRADTAAFVFADPTGLVQWRTPDRGVVTFPDLAAVAAAQTAVPTLVRAWIAA